MPKQNKSPPPRSLPNFNHSPRDANNVALHFGTEGIIGWVYATGPKANRPVPNKRLKQLGLA
jgi:hypothetical protein